MIKVTKKCKLIIIGFISALITISVFPLVAIASSGDTYYSGITKDIADHIIVKGFINSTVRPVGYALLKFLAYCIDLMYDVVYSVANFNLYTIISNKFDFTSFFAPLVWALLSLSAVIFAIAILIAPDRFKFHQVGRNLLIAIGLVICFPSLISACEDMRASGIKDMDSISVTANAEDTKKLGEQILATNVIDIDSSCTNGKLTYYDETEAYKSGKKASNLSINSTFENTKEFVVKITDSPYSNYGTADFYVNDAKIAEWLGVSDMYRTYLELSATNSSYSYISSISYDEDGNRHINYSEYNATEYADNVLLKSALVSSSKEYYFDYLGLSNSKNYTSWNSFSSEIISAFENLGADDSAYLSKSILDENGEPTDLYLTTLYDDNDFSNDYAAAGILDLGIAVKRIGRYIETFGTPAENVYRYDYQFLFGLVELLATLLALVFAAFRLGKLLYEVVFIQVIAPIVIATDVLDGQRRNKVINNLICTYITFIVVFLTLKLYLIALLAITRMDINFLVMIILIISGAVFVIDGPDIVVKLLGVDAGVKSGYGTLVGLSSAATVAKGVASAPGKVAGTAVGSVRAGREAYSSSRESGKGGFRSFGSGLLAAAGAAARSTPTGSAFSQAANNTQTSSRETRSNKQAASSSAQHHSQQSSSEPNGNDSSNNTQDDTSSQQSAPASTSQQSPSNSSTAAENSTQNSTSTKQGKAFNTSSSQPQGDTKSTNNNSSTDEELYTAAAPAPIIPMTTEENEENKEE